MKKIENREDLYVLVSQFYVKLLKDEEIKHFFDEMVEEEGALEKHLQILVDFWDNMLFYTGSYKRNAMRPHLFLHQEKPFLKKHFEIWLHHFNTTIDENFIGESAHAAKTRALSIATVMELKINQL